MDTPNILHIAADRAATSNPGHDLTLLIPNVSVPVSACLDLQDVMEQPSVRPAGADTYDNSSSGVPADRRIKYRMNMFCVQESDVSKNPMWGRSCTPGPEPGPAALRVEKQLTAPRLPAGWPKVLSETKLYSGQIKITFWGRTMGPLIWGQPK